MIAAARSISTKLWEAWDEFWFTPTSPSTLPKIRAGFRARRQSSWWRFPTGDGPPAGTSFISRIAPAPASAAMIGPAAINGPTPGIAKEPMPTSQPKTPPKTPPVPAPVAAPSGALVCCSCAKSRVPDLSGDKTRNIVVGKPGGLKALDEPFSLTFTIN